eukprot:8749094-Heterocapsa_arctica.AAC.1
MILHDFQWIFPPFLPPYLPFCLHSATDNKETKYRQAVKLSRRGCHAALVGPRRGCHAVA